MWKSFSLGWTSFSLTILSRWNSKIASHARLICNTLCYTHNSSLHSIETATQYNLLIDEKGTSTRYIAKRSGNKISNPITNSLFTVNHRGLNALIKIQLLKKNTGVPISLTTATRIRQIFTEYRYPFYSFATRNTRV